MFVEKTRNIQKAGGIGVIVLDNVAGSSLHNSNMFAMSGDGRNDIDIPAVFVFHIDGQKLLKSIQENPYLIMAMGGAHPSSSGDSGTASETDENEGVSNQGQPEDESHAYSSSDRVHSFKSSFAHESIMDQLDKFYEQALREESFKKRWMEGEHPAKDLETKISEFSSRLGEELKKDGTLNRLQSDMSLRQGIAYIRDQSHELMKELGLEGFEYNFNDDEEEQESLEAIISRDRQEHRERSQDPQASPESTVNNSDKDIKDES